MNPTERRAFLLEVIDELNAHGSWTGETHIQKCVFLLKEGLGVPVGVDFVLYKHGPYSFDLHDELEDMYSKFMIERKYRAAGYGPSVVTSESGKAFLSRTGKLPYERKIDFIAEKFGPRGVTELERVSTALYVSLDRPGSSPKERARELVRLKPHVPRELAESAVDELDELVKEAP